MWVIDIFNRGLPLFTPVLLLLGVLLLPFVYAWIGFIKWLENNHPKMRERLRRHLDV